MYRSPKVKKAGYYALTYMNVKAHLWCEMMRKYSYYKYTGTDNNVNG